MTFSSVDFLIFFSIVLAGTAFIERFFKQRVKEIFLLLRGNFNSKRNPRKGRFRSGTAAKMEGVLPSLQYLF